MKHEYTNKILMKWIANKRRLHTEYNETLRIGAPMLL